MDNDGVEAQRLQQHDVPHELFDQAGVVHGAASEFDQEGFVPVGLEVGKRADDDGCLFNQAGDFGVHISNATVEMIDAERGKRPVQSRRLLLK